MTEGKSGRHRRSFTTLEKKNNYYLVLSVGGCCPGESEVILLMAEKFGAGLLATRESEGEGFPSVTNTGVDRG